MMKILTWNMAGAGFHKLATHAQAWDWLLNNAEFDVALLQEAIPPAGLENSYRSALFQKRFPSSKIKWGNCILSREIAYQEFTPTVDPRWESAVKGPSLIAEPIGDEPWIINIHSNANHIPEFSISEFTEAGGLSCHSKKLWEIEVISHELKTLLSDKSFVLGGDLNSARLLDKIYKRSTNTRLWANLETQGYFDLRHPHSEDEQQTFFRQNTQPYQLDHLFSDAETRAQSTSWKVLPYVVEELQLSDHAPIIVEISY
jgi:endonuclease/exonuclease/phosphatase family metal-dependent hydrolase